MAKTKQPRTRRATVRDLMNYMKERELIRLRRLDGARPPWTKDKILQTYRFTNVHRADDYTTRVFQAIYRANVSPTPAGRRVLLLNCAIARYFGTAEFYADLGWQPSLDAKLLLRYAKERIAAGKPVFTQAYIITNGGKSKPKEEYVINDVLAPLSTHLDTIIYDGDPDVLHWMVLYDRLSGLAGFGGEGFMAKEVLQDFLLALPSGVYQGRRDWSPVGPGARRGLNRLAGRPATSALSESVAIAEVQAIHEAVAPWWEARFHTELTAHDVQFCLCEFDKYERALGGGKPKRTFTPRSRA